MPEYKNQHFVSRFYLENFSFDGGVRLNLLRVKEGILRGDVSIRDQCAKDYFYGKDLVIEKALHDIEGGTAEVLQRIVDTARMPMPGSDDDVVFRTHVALQWGRTRGHINAHRQSQEKMVQVAFAENTGPKTKFEEDFDSFSYEESVRMSVGISADLAPFIGDLSTKLIDANGFGRFVTSDTPIVMTNPYYLGRHLGGVTGLGVQGLVMFLPLSPRYLAIYYDRSYYRVGSPHAQTISVSSAADVAALNNFQCLHADSAVYFKDAADGPGIVAAYEKVKALRPADRSVVRRAIATSPDGPQEILHSFRQDLAYRPQLSFLSLLRKRKGPKEDFVSQVPMRSEDLRALFTDYNEEVFAGRRERSFLRYLVEKSGLDGPVAVAEPLTAARKAILALETLVSARVPK